MHRPQSLFTSPEELNSSLSPATHSVVRMRLLEAEDTT